MWENRLSKEREKRNKLMAKRRGSEGSKIGVGIIMGYKYLDGSLIVNGGGTTSVEKNYAEIGLRISW